MDNIRNSTNYRTTEISRIEIEVNEIKTSACLNTSKSEDISYIRGARINVVNDIDVNKRIENPINIGEIFKYLFRTKANLFRSLGQLDTFFLLSLDFVSFNEVGVEMNIFNYHYKKNLYLLFYLQDLLHIYLPKAIKISQ
jgi:hypothetical protein